LKSPVRVLEQRLSRESRRRMNEVEIGEPAKQRFCLEELVGRQMKKQLLLLFTVLLLFASCQDNNAPEPPPSAVLAPQQEQLQASIVKHAEQMQQAFMTGNLDAFFEYMHPDLIEGMGGKDKIKATMASGLSEMIRTIESTTMGKVSDVVVDGGRLVALIPVETLYNSFTDGKWIQTTYRIACSADNGESWTFMDGHGSRDLEDFFRQRFPILTKHIRFPKCKIRRVR